MNRQAPAASEPSLRRGRKAGKESKKKKKQALSEPKLHREAAPRPPPFRREDVHVIIDFEVNIQEPRYIPAELAMCAFSADRGIVETFHAFLKPGEFVPAKSVTAARHLERLITGIPVFGAPNARGDYAQVLFDMEAFLNRHKAVALYAKDAPTENKCLRYIVEKAGGRTRSKLLSGPVCEYHDLMSAALKHSLDTETTNQLFRQQTGDECNFHANSNWTPAGPRAADEQVDEKVEKEPRKARKLGRGFFHCALKDVCGASLALLYCVRNEAAVLQMNADFLRARAEAEEQRRVEKERMKAMARAAVVRVGTPQRPLLRVVGSNLYIGASPANSRDAEWLAAQGIQLLVCVRTPDGGGLIDVSLLDDADLGLIVLRVEPRKPQDRKRAHHVESPETVANRQLLESVLADGEAVCLCGPSPIDVKHAYRSWRIANGVSAAQVRQEIKIFMRFG